MATAFVYWNLWSSIKGPREYLEELYESGAAWAVREWRIVSGYQKPGFPDEDFREIVKGETLPLDVVEVELNGTPEQVSIFADTVERNYPAKVFLKKEGNDQANVA